MPGANGGYTIQDNHVNNVQSVASPGTFTINGQPAGNQAAALQLMML